MGPYIVLGVLAVLIFLCVFNPPSSNREDYSLDTHRIYGKYRVLYNDGYLSQPFGIQTARDYAKIFGGRVVARDYRGPYKTRGGKLVSA